MNSSRHEGQKHSNDTVTTGKRSLKTGRFSETEAGERWTLQRQERHRTLYSSSPTDGKQQSQQRIPGEPEPERAWAVLGTKIIFLTLESLRLPAGRADGTLTVPSCSWTSLGRARGWTGLSPQRRRTGGGALGTWPLGERPRPQRGRGVFLGCQVGGLQPSGWAPGLTPPPTGAGEHRGPVQPTPEPPREGTRRRHSFWKGEWPPVICTPRAMRRAQLEKATVRITSVSEAGKPPRPYKEALLKRLTELTSLGQRAEDKSPQLRRQEVKNRERAETGAQRNQTTGQAWLPTEPSILVGQEDGAPGRGTRATPPPNV